MRHASAPLSQHLPTVFSGWNTVPVAKFAISMPRETMKRVDRAAKRLGMTRSRYIAVVLDGVARNERDSAISRKVDEVLAQIGKQDMSSVALLRRARRDEGTEW
jgi:hypothetical protein